MREGYVDIGVAVAGSLDMVHLRTEWLRHRVLGSMLGVGKTERRQSHLTMHTPINSARLNTHHSSQPDVSVVSSSSPQVPYLHFHSSLLSPASASASTATAALCANTSSESLGCVVIFVHAHAGTTYFFGCFGFCAGNALELGVGELAAEDKDAVEPLNETARWNAGPEPKVGRSREVCGRKMRLAVRTEFKNICEVVVVVVVEDG